jgi:hypothetical protein
VARQDDGRVVVRLSGQAHVNAWIRGSHQHETWKLLKPLR